MIISTIVNKIKREAKILKHFLQFQYLVLNVFNTSLISMCCEANSLNKQKTFQIHYILDDKIKSLSIQIIERAFAQYITKKKQFLADQEMKKEKLNNEVNKKM